MAFRSRFFDSEAGDRVYTANAWAQVFGDGLVSDGVVHGKTQDLRVIEGNPPGMEVRVLKGVAWVAGRYFEVYSNHVLSVDDADSTNDRKDRVVVQLDYTARTVQPAVKTGTPATDPQPPALEDDSSRKEIGLAIVTVQAGASSIVDADISSTRGQDGVCPWARLLVQDNAAPGTVRMHVESYGPIPPGWALCDGANGTPDLRDRFVVGSGGQYAEGNTGGADTVLLTESHIPNHNHPVNVGNDSHAHLLSINDDSHSHDSGGSHVHDLKQQGNTDDTHVHNTNYETYDTAASTPTSGLAGTSSGIVSGVVQSGGSHVHPSSSHAHSGSADSDTHNHNATSAFYGNDTAHENRPPYYALAFIMKL